MFSLLAATELTDGVWYPKGGFTKVRESLLAIAEKKGAKVRLNSAVSEIVTEEVDGLASAKGGAHTGRKVTGVRLASGEVLEADVVVANPDLPCV